jgi:hypothetical protein
MGISFIGLFIVKVTNNDEQMYKEISKDFFRKPEVYKFAYAKKLDAKELLKGKISIEEFNSRQHESNMESMKQRTLRDLIGDIKKPGYFEKLKNFIKGLKSSKTVEEMNEIYRSRVDQICYDKAKKLIDEEMLNVVHMCKENR